MYLLDTNIVSVLRRPDKAPESVMNWQQSVSQFDCYISVITVLEIEIGIKRLARRDAAQAALIRAWLDDKVLPSFSGRILPFDLPAAKICSDFHVPDPASERDSFIAAIAQARGHVVVTRNVDDFASLKNGDGHGVSLLNPFDQN